MFFSDEEWYRCELGTMDYSIIQSRLDRERWKTARDRKNFLEALPFVCQTISTLSTNCTLVHPAKREWAYNKSRRIRHVSIQIHPNPTQPLTSVPGMPKSCTRSLLTKREHLVHPNENQTQKSTNLYLSITTELLQPDASCFAFILHCPPKRNGIIPQTRITTTTRRMTRKPPSPPPVLLPTTRRSIAEPNGPLRMHHHNNTLLQRTDNKVLRATSARPSTLI